MAKGDVCVDGFSQANANIKLIMLGEQRFNGFDEFKACLSAGV
jgi:hypothetical protein